MLCMHLEIVSSARKFAWSCPGCVKNFSNQQIFMEYYCRFYEEGRVSVLKKLAMYLSRKIQIKDSFISPVSAVRLGRNSPAPVDACKGVITVVPQIPF